MNTRQLKSLFKAQPTQDGAGVKIFRHAGSHLHQIMNPFLMVDEINSTEASDYLAGFPEHPHRGFETITYMKAGKMKHRDHMGNEEVIGGGDVQWMTAGRGVLHSEMPEQEGGLLHGFQIWLNLPAAEKMKPAHYQEILAHQVTTKRLETGGEVRVIAGDVSVSGQSLSGPMQGLTTEPVFVDVSLLPNERVSLSLSNSNTVITAVYSGATTEVGSKEMGLYSPGETLELIAGPEGVSLLLLAGNPIHEPIVQYGPFVMNSRTEIEQALRDFQDPAFLQSIA